jgi:hypothetical protein
MMAPRGVVVVLCSARRPAKQVYFPGLRLVYGVDLQMAGVSSFLWALG